MKSIHRTRVKKKVQRRGGVSLGGPGPYLSLALKNDNEGKSRQFGGKSIHTLTLRGITKKEGGLEITDKEKLKNRGCFLEWNGIMEGRKKCNLLVGKRS